MRLLLEAGAAPLPELTVLEALLTRLGDDARVRVLAEVEDGSSRYPVHGIVLGPDRPGLPTLGIVGGVHGLERVGTQVVLSYLTTLVQLLQWDTLLRTSLERTRIVLVPLVNPGGMARRRRSNPDGVDLMRNAPPRIGGRGSFGVGGQRWSSLLPWYMGASGEPMVTEAQALCDFMRAEVFDGSPSIVLDVHSGFGMADRLWFPYAYTRRPFPRLAEVYGLGCLLDRTLPNHVYRLEPQAKAYTIEGDLWDFMLDEHERSHPDRVLIPLTLEMGSWRWVRKNPRQLVDALGIFNPMQPHRLQRILRRHLLLLDFLHRASAAADAWCPRDDRERARRYDAAFARWYG